MKLLGFGFECCVGECIECVVELIDLVHEWL